MTLQIINDVRRLMQALRPSYLEDLGLLPTLEILLADMEASHDLKLGLRLGEARRPPAEAELVFYRAAQEALTNGSGTHRRRMSGARPIFGRSDNAHHPRRR